MKRFGNYQYLDGEMNERDKQEAGSKFWNKGKWDNFVLPFLPKDCNEMTLVDVGCNAGVFLKLAEEKGFHRVIGVDANREAIKRGIDYRNKVGLTYEMKLADMKTCLDELPVADFTVMANVHYYFPIHDWLNYVDRLESRTRYCIIVTAIKSHKLCKASARLEDIRTYFKNWDEVGFIDELPLEGDPFPRRLFGICFKSRVMDRVPLKSLDCGNHVQGRYWEAIDRGDDPLHTRYYKILKKYRRKNWSEKRLERFMFDKVAMYRDIKKNGIHEAIIVNSNNRILDGNHKWKIMRHLGYKTLIIRRT